MPCTTVHRPAAKFQDQQYDGKVGAKFRNHVVSRLITLTACSTEMIPSAS